MVFSDKIVLNSHLKLIIVDLKQINYVEADGAYSLYHLVDGKKERSSKSIHSQKDLSNHKHLIKISRSLIINVDNIQEVLKEKEEGILIFRDKTILHLSKLICNRLIQHLTGKDSN